MVHFSSFYKPWKRAGIIREYQREGPETQVSSRITVWSCFYLTTWFREVN